MAESSPLEAAAMSDERLSEIRTYWAGAHKERHVVELLAEVDRLRAAIAAYEAEQPAPDPERCYREFERAYSRAENNGGDWVARVNAGLAAVLAHLKGETR